MTGLRLARHRREFVADLISHERGFGFMTIVAGTCVLGSEMVVIADRIAIATVLLAIGGVLWLLLTYTIFTAVTIKRDKPTLAEGINGGWLLAVVATQSIAVLTALLAAHWQQPHAAGRELRRPLDVALGRDALHLDHRPDLLSLRVLSRLAGRSRQRRTGSTWARWRSPCWRARC